MSEPWGATGWPPALPVELADQEANSNAQNQRMGLCSCSVFVLKTAETKDKKKLEDKKKNTGAFKKKNKQTMIVTSVLSNEQMF